MHDIPVITLSNGLRVGNFSSPHTFLFEDGTVLPACSYERARSLMLEQHTYTTFKHIIGVDTEIEYVELSYKMSLKVAEALNEAQDLAFEGKADLFIVPLPVLKAIQDGTSPYEFDPGVFVTGKVIDRADPEKKLYINQFCW